MSKMVSETPEQVIEGINEHKWWKYLLIIITICFIPLWLSSSYWRLKYAYQGEWLYGVIMERDFDWDVTVSAKFPDGSFQKFYLDSEEGKNNLFYSSVHFPYPHDKDIVMLSYLSEYPNEIRYAEGVFDAWFGVVLVSFFFSPA
ncbi:MAG: hypothetical protein V1848_03590, partial [Candidatus Magasanikbacteria bacterium]